MEGRVALVTGAGSGIGAAIAAALLDGGWRVALAGRRAGRLEEAAARGVAGEALAVPADVTDPGSVEGLFAAVRDRWGRLDLLVNNAGVFGASAPVEEFSPDEWRTVVDTNLTGAFLCAQQAFRMMKDQDPQGGRIINNGSLSAHTPRPRSVAYTASKHAVTGLTKTLSLEGRPYRIACGQIDVGNAATELTGGFGAGTLQADGTVKAEPRMDVRHVVDAVLYMAGLPLEANVQSLTVMATTMPSFVGRG
ncbi:SDR family oxidoreductase [Actinomadura madurae]|uniref:SDR family oxidoreductase n=1 Tax=Actinomadura madurae TaxID=1993 RepID=UPI00202674E0|nr:SDR family NAD(P)-dependent oxidoreductase [Actinomadura madurae]MCP9947589.1 SDR family oxidoreductase [Actinomadura madurae]MCP9964354.1 SDR family oxidoreductase [Actinomadura madurae]MCP9976838.1 SDR family oxidoreductase [Actinomadura madurae]MCQ0011673.1 SDR family oxidoreductase [Actinomadura madurae]MCQ0013020.1 SDR family oxidoreductase [Actinomadura madurae]